MADYAALLQTITAMLIYSLILVNANRMILRNDILQVEGELEQETIALGQDILEEARTKDFDENSMGNLPPVQIPESFVAPSSLGPDAGESDRTDFDDFDDYHGWEDTVQTEHGFFNLRGEVTYVTKDTYDESASQSTYKKLKIYITSDFLKNSSSGDLKEYYLEFIRNYYAD